MKESRLTAVLGPTNTGKTFYAIERMCAYKTGIIGFPLRLLAREVYDKLLDIKGKDAIALMTGEERIIPLRPRFWICTVEAMPLNLEVEFVAVDEIQLCTDLERGHVFTDRLLNARGSLETMFLGSENVKKCIQGIIPNISVVKRERFSRLSYSGGKKLSRMLSRSAIVTFSADHVYSIAELIRRQKGGAAVIMGALSPRTRNAQVDLYQNGDVNHLVATDAIGMGLNLDIKHVAFERVSKFDGQKERLLHPNELAQIAGRAGRYLTDGTFGVTGKIKALDEKVIDSIENNKFKDIKFLQWRNSNLNFQDISKLIASLEIRPDNNNFVKCREADDLKVLKALKETTYISESLLSEFEVRLLWQVCQIPDFRKISFADHNNLLAKIFYFLKSNGIIPDDWLKEQVVRLDRIDGDIDTLSKRVAFIRTWTYVSFKSEWLRDSTFWQEETRRIEDRLSDALHERLTQTFVDRRTSVLLKSLKQRENLMAEINDNSEVFVEDQLIGRLEGFSFKLAESASFEEGKALKSTALAVLGPKYKLKSEKLYLSSDTDFTLHNNAEIFWHDSLVGKLVQGKDISSPVVLPVVDNEAGEEILEKIKRRLCLFIERIIESNFEPLINMKKDESITGLTKGVAFQLFEELGVIPRNKISEDIKALDQTSRSLLRKHGIRFGQYTIFHHLMLKPAATRMRLILWSVFTSQLQVPEAPPAGLVTIPHVSNASKDYYAKAGYRLTGKRAIRIDMLERLADLIRLQDALKGFEASVDMLSITGLTLEQFSELLGDLGFSVTKGVRKKLVLQDNESSGIKKNIPQILDVDATRDMEYQRQDLTQLSKDNFSQFEESIEDVDSKDTEIFYKFAFEPKKRPMRKLEKEGRSFRKAKQRNNEQISNGSFRQSKNKRVSNTKTLRSMKEKIAKIDPDNPFSVLLELKNKR